MSVNKRKQPEPSSAAPVTDRTSGPAPLAGASALPQPNVQRQHVENERRERYGRFGKK